MLLDCSYKSVVRESTLCIFMVGVMSLLLCFVVHPLRMNFWKWVALQTLVIRSGLRLEGFFGSSTELWNLRLLFCFLSLQNWWIRQRHLQCRSFLESIPLSCLKGRHNYCSFQPHSHGFARVLKHGWSSLKVILVLISKVWQNQLMHFWFHWARVHILLHGKRHFVN